MSFPQKLRQSYILQGTLNGPHGIYLVRAVETGGIFVKKELDVFNEDVYLQLYENPVPGTPRIADAALSDGKLVIIEEYMPGQPLEEYMENGLSVMEAVKITSRLCHILSELHSQDPPVIHRDIKPANVLVRGDGEICLIDFNAAKFYNSEETRDTVLIGTQGYAAPEQYGFGSSMPQTDIYALGVLMRKMTDHARGYNGCLDGLISDCTKMDPRDRIASANDLLTRLDAVVLDLEADCAGSDFPGTPADSFEAASDPAAEALAGPSGIACKQPAEALAGPFEAKSDPAAEALAGPSGAKSDPAAEALAGPSGAKSDPAAEALAGPSGIACKQSAEAGRRIEWLPPGFRSLRPVRMLLSAAGYTIGMLWALFYNYDAKKDVTGSYVQALCVLWFLTAAFIPGNYLNVQQCFPMCRVEKRAVRILGTILLTVLFLAAELLFIVSLYVIFA